jgi:hypothetical protein
MECFYSNGGHSGPFKNIGEAILHASNFLKDKEALSTRVNIRESSTATENIATVTRWPETGFRGDLRPAEIIATVGGKIVSRDRV